MPAVDHFGPEQVANWFFRLNGCLTIPNFIVHDDTTTNQRTDVDVLAVRFPHRRETAGGSPLMDHAAFEGSKRIDFIFAEIKTGPCNLNGPWTNPDKGNMNRALSAIGIIKEDALSAVADHLYKNGKYEDDRIMVRLFALGRARNKRLVKSVVQITWPEVARFFFDRFSKHGYYKRQHEQWDETGQRLFNLWHNHDRSRPEFIADLLDAIGVRSDDQD